MTLSEERELLVTTLVNKYNAIALNTKQTSEATGVSEITLKVNRATCIGIPYIKSGKKVSYSIVDIANYILHNRIKVA